MNFGKIPFFRALRSLLFAADGHLLLFLLMRFAVQPVTGSGMTLFLFLIPGTALNLFLLDRILHGKDPDPEKRDYLAPFLLYLLPALAADMILFPLTLYLLPGHPVWFTLFNLPIPAAAGILSLKKKIPVRQGLLTPLLLFPVILLLFLYAHFLFRRAGQAIVSSIG